MVSPIADGVVRLAPQIPNSRILTQDVFRPAPDRRYRLTVRVRAEGLAIRGVATSRAAEDLARRQGIPLALLSRGMGIDFRPLR